MLRPIATAGCSQSPLSRTCPNGSDICMGSSSGKSFCAIPCSRALFFLLVWPGTVRQLAIHTIKCYMMRRRLPGRGNSAFGVTHAAVKLHQMRTVRSKAIREQGRSFIIFPTAVNIPKSSLTAPSGTVGFVRRKRLEMLDLRWHRFANNP